jgi:hypothetical protein
MRRYVLLYKMLQDHDRSLNYPVYFGSIHGYPDIYAQHHISLVMHCTVKCQKFGFIDVKTQNRRR